MSDYDAIIFIRPISDVSARVYCAIVIAMAIMKVWWS